MEQKPQAASHMFWFFVLPCVVFLFWASFKLVNVSTKTKTPKDVFARIVEIEVAKSSGDRWQAAYALSQELQQLIRSGDLAKLPPDKKDQLFDRLGSLLKKHSTDTRLKRYLLLTLGQSGELRALASLETGLADRDPEVKFFSAWGYIEVLSKNSGAASPERLGRVTEWLRDSDPALQKIAATFLVQQSNVSYRRLVEAQLQSQNVEVRWNAAVALASVKENSAAAALGEMFDLEKLRAVEFKNSRDLQQIVATGFGAARKLGNAEVLAKAESLRAHAKNEAGTPEGQAILGALGR